MHMLQKYEDLLPSRLGYRLATSRLLVSFWKLAQMLMLKGNSTPGELLKRGRLNTTYLLLKASTGMQEEK